LQASSLKSHTEHYIKSISCNHNLLMRNFRGESNTVISIVPSDRLEFRSPVIEVLSLLAAIDFTFRKKSRRLRETLHLSVFINHSQKAKYSTIFYCSNHAFCTSINQYMSIKM